MYETNLVVLCGTISGEPRIRELPAGSSVTNLELSTWCAGATMTVPVAVHDPRAVYGAGEEICVLGYVRRRFFRSAGMTQSRTEVVAIDVQRAARKRAVSRLLANAVSTLQGHASTT